jgi:serine/threonine protein phosphatase PrpC
VLTGGAMPGSLRVSIGQHSDPGRKPVNQDFHGAFVPGEPLLSAKGIVIALADGIGSSDVSQVASEFAVRSVLDDYPCTSHAWSVKTSAQRVLAATNSWLHAQTQRSPYRFERDRGYVCTLSAMVIKSTTAHLLHVGDSRIYRLQGRTLEPLTEDHRVQVSSQQSYLGRALGAARELELDYATVPLDVGDLFVLATDGVHEHMDGRFVAHAIAAHTGDLDTAAKAIVDEAYRRGSTDNLTLQVVRIDALPAARPDELQQRWAQLPHPAMLQPRMAFDGFRIERELHHSNRSHLYLATDEDSGARVVLKTLATELQHDAGSVERFLLEEWVARRIDNAHVLKPSARTRAPSHLYVATEFIDGQTLEQWMRDHPRPDTETVRGFIEQIARGLQAFHRLEMVHQDVRPANVMIDSSGTLKIIDFGLTRVAGIVEGVAMSAGGGMLGTPQYTAPEMFLGETGSARSDIFSLGVIVYQLLTGRLPYGTKVARSRTRSEMNRLVYVSARDDERDVPAWLDDTLRRALHPDPFKRYGELSEFVHDLRHPNPAFLARSRPALIERNPVMFWKVLSLVLAFVVLLLVASRNL